MAVFSGHTYKDKVYSLIQSVGGNHVFVASLFGRAVEYTDCMSAER